MARSPLGISFRVSYYHKYFRSIYLSYFYLGGGVFSFFHIRNHFI